MTVELNTFFLKFCLWIPPRNPLIVYRLVLWWLIAIPTIREYNTYLQDRYLSHPLGFLLYNVFLPFCYLKEYKRKCMHICCASDAIVDAKILYGE